MALALVAVVVLSGTPGIALAALLAIAVLCGRAASSAVRALAGRRGRRATAPPAPVPARRRRGPTAPQRALRVATMAALLTLALAAISFTSALSARSASSFGIRTVEWLRDNGAQSVVSDAENAYYTLTAPAKGGRSLSRLPTVGVGGDGAPARSPSVAAGYRPPRVRPVLTPALPGEGVWRRTTRTSTAGAPGVLVTTYRPDRDYPRVVAGLAWIDPRRAAITLQPGLQEPPGGGARGPAEVPGAQRARLLATFNSGFKHADSNAGFYAGGRLLEPLVRGQGTIVGTRDGRVDVRTWTGGTRPPPDVTFARQNLPLIVDRGRPNPNLSDGPEWGVTLGNAVLVWRSGVGVDRRGNLIYAVASDQSVKGLAQILIHAGAVRALQLDINSYWVSFNTYSASGARKPRKLLPDTTRPATRYLSPDDRDFFSVYSR